MHDQSWEAAWDERYGRPEAAEAAPPPARPRRRSPRTRSVVLATAILGVTISPFAVAEVGDALREGVRNGTTQVETEIVADIAATNGPKGGYATRQSNLSSSGGGAIYGCRSTGAANTDPCVRANNLSTGKAFEFHSRSGNAAGEITVGTGGDTKAPFTTNATGVATGLNADRVDGLNASQISDAAVAASRSRWALVNEAGQIEAQSGGFKIIDAYATNDNVYIDAGESLVDNGFAATIALQNGVNVDGADGDAEPNFSGEISVARCQVPGIVECAPAGAKNENAFVVSPRNSDGTATTATTRKRFYVVVTAG